MKINLDSIDRENFLVLPNKLASGEDVWLVNPNHIGAKYTIDTLKFRSSVWNTNGELISAGFPKFFNLGEKPDMYPALSLHNDHVFPEKIDGSLLICSHYKGELIIRTRGTVDATRLDNGFEIPILVEKYNHFFSHLKEGKDELKNVSFLFEWVTPNNKIILSYPEPDLFLIGCINHDDYSFDSQETLDEFAPFYGLLRPNKHSFDDIEKMPELVKAFKGLEGVCVYYNNGQNVVKVKGESYLYLHKMKSEFGNQNKIAEVYFDAGYGLSVKGFLDYIEKTFDFEIAKMIEVDTNIIVDKVNECIATSKGIFDNFTKFKAEIDKKGLDFKKYRGEFARAVFASEYKKYSDFFFKALDGQDITSKDFVRKLYFYEDE